MTFSNNLALSCLGLLHRCLFHNEYFVNLDFVHDKFYSLWYSTFIFEISLYIDKDTNSKSTAYEEESVFRSNLGTKTLRGENKRREKGDLFFCDLLSFLD